MADERARAPKKPGHDSTCEFDAEAMTLKLDTTFHAELKAVPRVVDRILAITGEMGCSGKEEFEIRLAISEALINAIEHGCHHDRAKKIRVCVECDPEKGMLIVVRDPGGGFDPSKIPSPVEGERLFRDRGRGIFLISQFMDEVRFEHGGTEIRMRKHRPRPTPPRDAK